MVLVGGGPSEGKVLMRESRGVSAAGGLVVWQACPAGTSSCLNGEVTHESRH